MGMYKVDYIRRIPGIGDYNKLVDAINVLIDKVQEKKEIVHITIDKEVKDYSFFHQREVPLPFKTNCIVANQEDAVQLFWAYAFTYKEATQINDAVTKWNIVALDINVTEQITEKEKKQEATFETIEATTIEELNKPKKRGRPKRKTSWN